MINPVTSHEAEVFVGGLWAVHPESAAFRGEQRKQCAVCETCKARFQRGFALCG
jgi:hypothetical protein